MSKRRCLSADGPQDAPQGVPPLEVRGERGSYVSEAAFAALKSRRLSITITMMVLIHLWAASASAGALTLGEGIREAVEKSRLVKMSLADESIAGDEALIDRARLLPSVNAEANGTALAYQPGAVFGTVSVPTAERNFIAYSLSVQQLVYDFRGSSSRYEATREKVNSRKFDTKRIRNLAAIDFALAFFDLLESERMVMVAGREVERLEAHSRDAASMYEAGVITKNDLLQAEVRLSDSRQRRLQTENLRSVNASRVNNALQRPLGTDVQAVDLREEDLAGLSEAVRGLPLEKAWETAEKKRAELLIVDSALKSLDFEERAKKAEYYPRIFAQGGVDYADNRYQVHETNWSLILGVRVNLFSGGSTAADVARTVHQRDRAREDRRRIVEGIRLEVERYVLEARSARDRVAVTRNSMQQADENLRINRVRYSEGVGTATEVLDAVTLLTVAETNYYRAVYDLGKYSIAVFYAIGEDLTEVYR